MRLYVLELSDLGSKVVQDLATGRSDVPRALLAELEIVLDNPQADPESLAGYMWEGLRDWTLSFSTSKTGIPTSSRPFEMPCGEWSDRR